MNPLHRAALFGLCALAALQVIWYGWWVPVTGISKPAAISLALVWFALPLLAARRDTESGLLVGALVSLLFFSHGVMEVWANQAARLPALIEIALSLGIVTCAGWPSWQQARARKMQRLKQSAD
jgi:uncharacterized membrane protein